MEVNEFFNENYGFYNQDLLEYDYYFMEFIKNKKDSNSNVLDIGGGNGNFSKLVIKNCPDIDITILDPSEKLLSNLNDPKINKIVGKLPDDIPLDNEFDFIHIKEVLHHITGNTTFKSKLVVKDALNNLKYILSDDGFLLIHELYYEGFLISKFPNYLIFYSLKLQNKLNIKMPAKEFLLGLNVYFYTRNELKSMLNECGFQIIGYKVDRWSNNLQKKILLIKNWGRVLIIAKKNRCNLLENKI